ncbi:competence protein CoiA family protein [Streptomyces sp. NPDC005056]
MAHGVFHKELGEINLSELDLNHPADARLWRQLYGIKGGKTPKGHLECLDCRERDPGCPQWMFLQMRQGRPIAVHYTTGIRHPTRPESPRHKALKERIARAAETAGFSAELEARAPDGRRRTDVLVHGDKGLRLGCEIQLSYETGPSVSKRTDIARADGLSPLWTTDDRGAPLIDRAPWARIDHLPEEAISSGNALLVRGGVKGLEMVRCDSTSPVPCPDRNYGRCNQWHGAWSPVHGMHLDQLIGATAGGQYVPLYLPARQGRRGRAAHMWVTAQDRETFLDVTGEKPALPEPGTVDDDEPAAPARLALNRNCTYTETEKEKKQRGSIPRDTGASVPTGITVPDRTAPVSPQARSSTFLSHIASRHRAVPQQAIPHQRPPLAPASSTTDPLAGPNRPLQQPTPVAVPAQPFPAARPLPPAPVTKPGPAAAPQPDRPALATRLGCRPEQVGPCASCHEPTVRYGDGGNPLCPCCKARRARSVSG